VNDVAAWLAEIGLAKLSETFRANDIDFDILPALDDSKLKELGLSLGDRVRLLRAIADLANTLTATEPRKPIALRETPSPERRQLTIVFIDLVDSTALSQALDPEDLRDVMRGYHEVVANAIRDAGGFVAKFMGDGILAYFGYPHASEDAAENAVRAALRAVAAVKTLPLAMGRQLSARAGIATGPVVVGDVVGDDVAREVNVVGETPNIAARLLGLGEPNSVTISSSSRRMIGDLFTFDGLGPQKIKGIAEPIIAFKVTGEPQGLSRFEAIRVSPRAPLVGRAEELALMLTRWEMVTSGDGQLILLSGEAGLGKSRLSYTFRRRIAEQPHVCVQYQCSPRHTNSSFYPVAAQLIRAAGIEANDAPVVMFDKLSTLLNRGDASELDIRLIASLLGIEVEGKKDDADLTPAQRREHILGALVKQFEALAGKQPTLLFVEDAHWIDPSTEELIHRVLRRVQQLRTMVLVTFRPEYSAPWKQHPAATQVTLTRLARSQVTALLNALAGTKVLPDAVVDHIVARTDGVPLFVEEMFEGLRESGLLVEEATSYRLARTLNEQAIPASLQDSLMARLDRLASAKMVAQAGAVIGREFSYSLLEAVAALDEVTLKNALGELTRAGLVFPRGEPPDATYTFKHALVQDAAHHSLLRSSRQQLHARIVRSLESGFAETSAAQPDVLAHHSTEAGFTEKAVTYWLKAGEQSVARSAIREAVAQFSKGLEQLSRLPESRDNQYQELQLQSALGNVLTAVKGFAAPEPARAYARVRELCEVLGETTHVCRMLFGQWLYRVNAGEVRTAQQIAEDLLHLGEQRQEPTGLIMGHLALSGTLFGVGDFSRSKFHIERLFDLHEPARDKALIQQIGTDAYIGAWAWLPLNLILLGYPDQACAQSRNVILAARTRGHAPTLGWCLSAVCRFYALLGDKTLFANSVDEFATLAAARNFPLWLAQANAYRGWISVCEGDTEQGLARLREGVSQYRATGALFWLPFLMRLLAAGYGSAGDAVSEARSLDDALALSQRTGEVWFAPELHRLKGLLACEDRAAAEQQFRCALDIARRQRSMLWQLRAATSLARLLRDQGKLDEARNLLGPVYGRFTEGFDTPDLKQAAAMLDEL